jgi:hypothetical protein
VGVVGTVFNKKNFSHSEKRMLISRIDVHAFQKMRSMRGFYFSEMIFGYFRNDFFYILLWVHQLDGVPTVDIAVLNNYRVHVIF